MPDAVTHPSRQELSDFGLGRLPAEAAATVAGHLETCPACQKAVADLPPDSFLGKVQAAKLGQSSMPRGQSIARADAVNPPDTAAAPPEGLPPELASYPKYRFVRELGRGGMGVVYQAEQTLMGRFVAVKVISPSVLAHPDALPRFQSEVKAAAKLDHPNIVRAHDAEQVGSLHLLVMEYVEGTNLADLVQRKGPLSVAHAGHFIRQAALGLQHAFEQGMVHRDLKPHNLMVTPKGQVKILDFGLARLRSGGPGLTEMGSFMGTPEYVSPEQASDARTADTRADLYSLGCTLYFLLTGRPPFVEDTAVKTILAHIEKEAPPLHELRSEVPAELSAVVARLLAKDPAQRYQQPVELARALVPFIKQGPKREGVSLPPLALPVSDRGTVMGANTSKVLKAQENPASQPPAPPATVEEKPAAPFADLVEPATPLRKDKRRRPAKAAPASWLRDWRVLTGTGAAVLIFGLIGLWAAGVLKVKTPHGIIVLEDVPADAEVNVAGPTVTLTRNGEEVKVTAVSEGPYWLRVVQRGQEIWSSGEVRLKVGGDPVRLRVERPSPPRPAETTVASPPQHTNKVSPVDRRAAEWALSLGGTVWVRTGGNEKEIGAIGGLPAESFELLAIDLGKSKSKRVGDDGLAHLAGLTNLTRLFLAGQGITDVGLVHLKGMTQLTELGLFSNSKVTDAGLAQIAGLTNLTNLDLNGTGVTDAGMVHLKGMTNLTALNLMGTRVTGSGFVHLKGLTKLRVFFLAGSTVDDAGLAQLAGLTSLVHFGLERTRVSDAGLVHLKGLANLAILDLSNLTISDAGLLHLHGLMRLRNLNLIKTKVTSEGVVALQKALPNCQIRTDPGTTKPNESTASPGIGAGPDANGFVPLFNGKDLSGWMVDGGAANGWGVTGGELIGRGKDFKTRGYLLTERMYTDFRLRLEFSLAPGANAGIALRALQGEKVPHKGMISDHPVFKLIANRGTEETGTTHWVLTTTDVAPSQAAELQPAGSWNRLEIEVKGRSLRAWVNDKQVVNVTLAENARLSDGSIPALNRPRGRVGLQKHTGVVRFRNVLIKELSAVGGGPKTPHGFRVSIPEHDWGKWRVTNGYLEQTAVSGFAYIWFGETTWSDYDYTVDFLRVRGNDQGGLYFLQDGEKKQGCLFGLSSFANTAHSVEWWAPWKPKRSLMRKKGSVRSGTWHTARVSVRNGRAQCFLDGHKLFDWTIDSHSTGRVGLRTYGSSYRFRNIKVTDPQGKRLLEGLPDLESAWEK